MSKYGDLDFDERWYDEPINRYLEHKQTADAVTDQRYNAIYGAVVDSPEGTEWQAWDEFVDWRDEMTLADARAFKQQLEAAGLGSRTVKTHLLSVQSFLRKLLERKVVDSNPVAYILDETEFNHDDRDKIERNVTQVGGYLQNITNLQIRAIGTTFAKTGIRGGENHNIDLPFLYLDHEIYEQVLNQHDVTLVDEVADYPDTLYIPSEPTMGEQFRGEMRIAGNKRKRGTRIPIDAELKKALIDWFAIRPETAHPHPLWVSPLGRPTRIASTTASDKLTNYWAEKTGFIDDGGNGDFTPHWFRHFFTTNMQPGRGHHEQSIPPTLVKYIRGDVGTTTDSKGRDIMDVYSHDWGDQVRDQYLKNIYHFGIYD